MIVPNLMVSDVKRSIAFYRDRLGLTVVTTVAADRTFAGDGDIVDEPVFAVLEWNGAQLMLQSVESLAGELSVFSPDQKPSPSGTIYFRGFDPDGAVDRFSGEDIVKGPELTWYGMKELYIRDPDGHVICLGAPEGPPVASDST